MTSLEGLSNKSVSVQDSKMQTLAAVTHTHFVRTDFFGFRGPIVRSSFERNRGNVKAPQEIEVRLTCPYRFVDPRRKLCSLCCQGQLCICTYVCIYIYTHTMYIYIHIICI